MRSAWETYFQHLSMEPTQEEGDVNGPIGHFALIMGGLAPITGISALAEQEAYFALNDAERATLERWPAAIVHTNEQGFMRIDLYESDVAALDAFHRATQDLMDDAPEAPAIPEAPTNSPEE